MLDGFRVLKRALGHLNHRGYIYIWANLLWFVLSALVITAPAAWAGLALLSHRVHTQPSVSLSDFFEGFRVYFRQSLVLGLLNLVMVVVNVSNIISYRESIGILFDVFQVAWVLILFTWFSIQLYVWTLFYEMEQPNLIAAMRNAALMFLLNPFFTLSIWLGILLVVLLSLILVAPWALLTGSMIVILTTTAVLNRLEAAGLRQPLPKYVTGEYSSED